MEGLISVSLTQDVVPYVAAVTKDRPDAKDCATMLADFIWNECGLGKTEIVLASPAISRAQCIRMM